MLPPGPRMSRAEQTARWIARPGPFLFNAHREFGDVFTIHIGTEPPWAVLAHPDAVREVFTGDAATLHAGKANLILLPFLGSSSVLLLDGPTHLRQRKLMLPPFHGKRMAGYRGRRPAHRPRARRRVAARRPLKLAPRLQAITLDVVLRVIFGVARARRGSTSCAAALRTHDGGGDGRAVAAGAARARPPSAPTGAALPRPSCGPSTSCCASRSPPAGPTRRRRALAAARRARRGRQPDDRPASCATSSSRCSSPGTRRRRRRSPGRSSGCSAPGGWDRLRAGGEEYAEAAGKEALRLRPVLPVVLRHLQRDMTIAGHDLPAGTVVAPASRWCTAARRSTPSRRASRPSASSAPSRRAGPTRGSRSAAACAAASAPPSR